VGILADAIDPLTGEFISLFRSFDPTDSAVLLAMSVERGSGASVEDVGNQFSSLDLIDDTAPDFFKQETKRALKPLIDAGQVALKSVDTTTYDNTAELEIHYENVRRREARDALVTPGKRVMRR